MAEKKAKAPVNREYPKVLYVYRNDQFIPVTVLNKEERSKFASAYEKPSKKNLEDARAKAKASVGGPG
jgi:hypothetical protein